MAAEALARLADAIGTPPSLTLGGWSYGGVVALAMAARLAAAADGAPSVRAVLLLDAPLGQSAGRGFHRDGADARGALVGTLRAQLAPLVGGDGAALDDLSAHAAAHFEACNALLDAHDPTGAPRVACDLVDVRPPASECAFLPSLAPLTAGTVHGRAAAGDHFSMCFGDNAAALADAVAPFLGEEVDEVAMV